MTFDFSKETDKPAAWFGLQSGNVTVSSFLRLARNAEGLPFPAVAKKDAAKKVRKAFMDHCRGLDFPKGITVFDSAEIPDHCRGMLEERLMLFSPLPWKEDALLAISGDETLSILVNRQDHFLLRSIAPGNMLKKQLPVLLDLSKRMEKKIPFAFHRKYGYLTGDPADAGTGLHAGALFHIPGLVLDGSIQQVLQGMDRLGFSVRRSSPENEPDSGFYTVTTRGTLGETEEEITERMDSLIHHMEDHEKEARMKLMREQEERLRDRIGRAYGLLRYGYRFSAGESLEKLSLLRLGIDLGMFSRIILTIIDLIILDTRPGHLTFRCQGKLSPADTEFLRASVLRASLKAQAAGGK